MGSDSISVLPEALRLIRTRKRLTQAAASKLPGAPDYRTLSHWETARKIPSLKLLSAYLKALGLDFCDLQEAMDQVHRRPPMPSRPSPAPAHLDAIAKRLEAMACTVAELESLTEPLKACRPLQSGRSSPAQGTIDDHAETSPDSKPSPKTRPWA